MLSFNLIYNLKAGAALLKIFMGLALVHFQKYWLLRVIFDQWPKLNLGFDVEPEIQILKVIYYSNRAKFEIPKSS